MLSTIILTFAIFAIVCAVHIGGIAGTARHIRRISGHGRRTACLLPLLLALHLAGAALFAIGFYFGGLLGRGALSGSSPPDAMDQFYFSLINMTTLGLGDVYPVGHLRFLAGVESLTGFLLLSCSASYVFQSMHHGVEER